MAGAVRRASLVEQRQGERPIRVLSERRFRAEGIASGPNRGQQVPGLVEAERGDIATVLTQQIELQCDVLARHVAPEVVADRSANTVVQDALVVVT